MAIGTTEHLGLHNYIITPSVNINLIIEYLEVDINMSCMNSACGSELIFTHLQYDTTSILRERFVRHPAPVSLSLVFVLPF